MGVQIFKGGVKVFRGDGLHVQGSTDNQTDFVYFLSIIESNPHKLYYLEIIQDIIGHNQPSMAHRVHGMAKPQQSR